jgi:hypothetical protein
MNRLRTEAWLLRGISSIPGELVLEGGALKFIARGTGSAWPWQIAKIERALQLSGYASAAKDGKPFALFEWPVSEVDAVVPWYYFGGGIVLARNGRRLRFSFGSPASTNQSLASAFENIRKVGAMRSRGKLWSAAIEKASRKPGDPASSR